MSAEAQSARSSELAAFLGRAATSSLGAKLVMAVSGLLFLAWLGLHLVGNLALFGGPDTMNKYAALLAGNPPILWGQRIGLFLVAAAHIASGLRLAHLNKRARPEPYASPRRWRKASLASRTMAASGLVVLTFLVFHLGHFTLGLFYSGFAHFQDPAGRHDVYRMVISGFQIPWVAAFYALSVGLVGFHVSHGFWSAFQSLGLWGKKWTPLASKLSLFIAVVMAAAFMSLPLSVLFGLLR